MQNTMNFYSRLDGLFESIEKKTGLSKQRILIELGLDPAQFRAYKKANRVPSNPMLISISKSSLCPYSITTLSAWKALHEYGIEVIQEAAKLARKDKALTK